MRRPQLLDRNGHGERGLWGGGVGRLGQESKDGRTWGWSMKIGTRQWETAIIMADMCESVNWGPGPDLRRLS